MSMSCNSPEWCLGLLQAPFLLNTTLQHHMSWYSTSHPEVVRQLSNSIYVDDIVSGEGNEEKAYQHYFISKGVKGGFKLGKFVTNAEALQQTIDGKEGVLMSHKFLPPVS